MTGSAVAVGARRLRRRRRRLDPTGSGGLGGAIRLTNIGAASATASRTSRICSSAQTPTTCGGKHRADHHAALSGTQPVMECDRRGQRSGGLFASSDGTRRRREAGPMAAEEMRRRRCVVARHRYRAPPSVPTRTYFFSATTRIERLRMEEDLDLAALLVGAVDLVAAVLDLDAADLPAHVGELALELGLRPPLILGDRFAALGMLGLGGAGERHATVEIRTANFIGNLIRLREPEARRNGLVDPRQAQDRDTLTSNENDLYLRRQLPLS